jgi:hypothetical protein
MITIIDRLRGIAKAIPPCNNGTSEGGYTYEAEVMLRAADELAAMQARAERAQKVADAAYRLVEAMNREPAKNSAERWYEWADEKAKAKAELDTARSEAGREGE